MKVSIVTNAFNQRRFLERALKSVLEQDYPDIEYIVIDPGSTDGSTEILHQYKERYGERMVLVEEPDNGPADGLNKGFARATGEIFGYLNADDAYLPGAIGAAVQGFQRHRDAQVIYADGYIVDEHGAPLRRLHAANRFTPRRFVWGMGLVLQQSTFYRAEAFRAVGGFNTDNYTSWDGELLLDIAMKGMALKKVPGYWSVFTIHKDSITGSQRYADESLRTHKRYFRTVMNRERTDRDMAMVKLLQIGQRLSNPGHTIMRVRDALFGAPALRVEGLHVE